MILEPGGMDGITAETAGTNPMMLTPDHAAQSGKVAFCAIDVDAIEKTVGIRVIDPLDVECLGKLVPVTTDLAKGTASASFWKTFVKVRPSRCRRATTLRRPSVR